jgi:hypothetical protein
MFKREPNLLLADILSYTGHSAEPSDCGDYNKKRELLNKIVTSGRLRQLGTLKNSHIVEIIAIVENKGSVRHFVNDFKFDLLYLSKDHEIKEGDERINKQLLFEKIIDKRYWIPPSWYNSFIDAGIVQNYTYVTTIPIEAKFILVYAQFKYPGFSRFLPIGRTFHTAQKTFPIQG